MEKEQTNPRKPRQRREGKKKKKKKDRKAEFPDGRSVEMASCKSSFVSILNNDDNPSFAVRSTPGISRQGSSSSTYSSQSEHQPRPSRPDYSHGTPYAESSAARSPGRAQRPPFDPVSQTMQPTSPGSSSCSSYDYMTHPSASTYYHSGRPESYGYPPPAIAPAEKRLSGNSASEPPSPPKSLGASKDTTSAKGSRKNKYPCPYANSHGCTATFTTSGHAARHGKKHTGEKSVHCPICNKAFTRKDNMKQHIRTHRTHSEDNPTGTVERDSEGTSSRWSTRRSSPQQSHSRSGSQSQADGNSYQHSMDNMNLTTSSGSHRRHSPY
ncbi:C2H2-type zinc finger protein [Aspergillus clavatus NRRL 1]|uniref:C2H2 transcription factor (Egr2), putative n=1 Tax=Aspergillus clavatus (strain ATCC 1007 / CBS 513.65 / DSM 816 / NCTC 3887 / NRRL 1 / QM 1276 / 107) TaxID=344612 RepID=A1CQ92_ASPCL|nr:C2H2 transcription factor (Egr2), putative [Aspergillus clavatus NRRL 1]EAW07813.1 C2H2 transcription factor (Egr2), putative [Aspergillus clavatus NRRL 1]